MEKEQIVESGYNRRFYDDIVANRSSADIIVPIVLEYAAKALKTGGLEQTGGGISVIDFGCGTGQWLAAYKENGCRILGLDGDRVEAEQLVIEPEEFAVHDLKTLYRPEKKATIANCLEVAEHIEEEYADTLVDSLVNTAEIIAFSAAIPFQRGVHHVNCQWQSYWVEKFDKRGYQVLDCIRKRIWTNDDVQPYYRENMFLYVNRESGFDDLLALADENNPAMYDLVHPRMWESLCNAKFMKIVYSIYYKHHWVYDIYDKLVNRR